MGALEVVVLASAVLIAALGRYLLGPRRAGAVRLDGGVPRAGAGLPAPVLFAVMAHELFGADRVPGWMPNHRLQLALIAPVMFSTGHTAHPRPAPRRVSRRRPRQAARVSASPTPPSAPVAPLPLPGILMAITVSRQHGRKP